MNNKYQIQLAKEEELGFYYKYGPDELSKGYETYYKISPEYFFVGKLGDQIISKIFCIKYLKNYACIEGYFVKDEFRGKGYGVQIFKRAFESLKDFDCIKLVSVEQQKANYEKWGFKTHCQVYIRSISQFPQIDQNRNTIVTTNINQINLKQLAQFDKKYAPYDREEFLTKVLSNNYPFVSLDKVTNKIVGYSCVCEFEKNFQIHIMIAQNNQVAQDLVKEMILFAKRENQKRNLKHTLKIYSDHCEQHIVEFVKHWFPNCATSRFYLMFLNRGNIPNMVFKNSYGSYRT